MATEPRLLLLDEPLAALDVTAPPSSRRVLRTVLTGRTTVMVTHDLLDALLLGRPGGRAGGRPGGRDRPDREVLRHPRTSFTARLAGLNLVTGTATGTGVVDSGGVHWSRTGRPACVRLTAPGRVTRYLCGAFPRSSARQHAHPRAGHQ